jgi:ankyrin repeat protein
MSTLSPLHSLQLNTTKICFHFLQLPQKLDEFDPSTGGVPLNIALVEQQESIAKQLVTNGCDVNVPDSEGSCLLHKAIERGDEFASTFLIKNGANVNAVTTTEQISPLHLAASYKYVFRLLCKESASLLKASDLFKQSNHCFLERGQRCTRKRPTPRTEPQRKEWRELLNCYSLLLPTKIHKTSMDGKKASPQPIPGRNSSLSLQL